MNSCCFWQGSCSCFFFLITTLLLLIIYELNTFFTIRCLSGHNRVIKRCCLRTHNTLTNLLNSNKLKWAHLHINFLLYLLQLKVFQFDLLKLFEDSCFGIFILTGIWERTANEVTQADWHLILEWSLVLAWQWLGSLSNFGVPSSNPAICRYWNLCHCIK